MNATLSRLVPGYRKRRLREYNLLNALHDRELCRREGHNWEHDGDTIDLVCSRCRWSPWGLYL